MLHIDGFSLLVGLTMVVFASSAGGEPEREAGREAAVLEALPLPRVTVPLGAMIKTNKLASI